MREARNDLTAGIKIAKAHLKPNNLRNTCDRDQNSPTTRATTTTPLIPLCLVHGITSILGMIHYTSKSTRAMKTTQSRIKHKGIWAHTKPISQPRSQALRRTASSPCSSPHLCLKEDLGPQFNACVSCLQCSLLSHIHSVLCRINDSQISIW